MAELTKTQIKKQTKSLLEKLEEIKLELEELHDDVENEISNIEPYEGRNELTKAQQDRQDWLDNVSSALDELINNIDTNELEGYMEE